MNESPKCLREEVYHQATPEGLALDVARNLYNL